MPCGKRIFRTAAGRKENFSHGPCVWRSIYYSLFRLTGTLRYVSLLRRYGLDPVSGRNRNYSLRLVTEVSPSVSGVPGDLEILQST